MDRTLDHSATNACILRVCKILLPNLLWSYIRICHRSCTEVVVRWGSGGNEGSTSGLRVLGLCF